MVDAAGETETDGEDEAEADGDGDAGGEDVATCGARAVHPASSAHTSTSGMSFVMRAGYTALRYLSPPP